MLVWLFWLVIIIGKFHPTTTNCPKSFIDKKPTIEELWLCCGKLVRKVVGRSGGCELLRGGGNTVPVLCPAPALTTSGYQSQRVPTLKNTNWTGLDWTGRKNKQFKTCADCWTKLPSVVKLIRREKCWLMLMIFVKYFDVKFKRWDVRKTFQRLRLNTL